MNQITGQDGTDRQHAIREANRLLEESAIVNSRYKDKLNELKNEFITTAAAIKGPFSKSLTDAISGSTSFASAFEKVRKSLEEVAIRTAITNPLADYIFGGISSVGGTRGAGSILPSQADSGIIGQLVNGIGDLFGARAFGGPVGAGKPYLVGERGPELFVPQTAGRINPEASGGGVNITMHISTPDAASFRASENQIAAAMMDAARKAQRIR